MGGSLDFLFEQGFALPYPLRTLGTALDTGALVAVNPMVAIETKRRDADALVIALRAVSSLSGAEYLRFKLLCCVGLLQTIVLRAMLASLRCVPLCCVPCWPQVQTIVLRGATDIPAYASCLQVQTIVLRGAAAGGAGLG
jgi:hypothetical protein